MRSRLNIQNIESVEEALQEWAVRLDELNQSAGGMDPVEVVRRLLGISENLAEDLFCNDPAPELFNLRAVTHGGFVSKEEQRVMQAGRREGFEDNPFTREASNG